MVPRTREQLRAQRRVINSRMTLRAQDRLFAGLPLFHAAGLFKTMLGSLEHGCTLYLEPYSPRTAAATIEREEITVVHAAPFAYKALAETRFASRPRFGSVRLATFGTALMPPEVVRKCREEFGLLLTPEYGTTEAGTSAMGLPLRGELEPGWVGWPFNEVTADILGPDGECLPPGHEGQLAIRNPAAADGYLDDPEAAAATFRDGRVLTGDLAFLTPEGGIRLVGRMKDMISIAGKKVSPAEVEAVLREHPDVSEALVVPARTDDGQEVVSAYVETAAALTPGALRAFCAERLAAFKLPRRMRFVSQLPRSATGKVVRRVPPGAAEGE
jgi:long-chain acyl-CoA synthetase